jgi:putative ABC transport system permease protein
MSFLGVFIYAGVGGEWYGLRTTVNKYYTDTNFANVWVYGKDFSEEDSQAVTHLNEVTNVERRLTLNATVDYDDSPELTLHFVEKNEISRCLLIDGEPFSNKEDGIWLDDLFAKSVGFHVGDTISLTSNGITLRKKILGTILSPEYVYSSGGNDIIPNHAKYGFAYLPPTAFPDNIEIFYTDLLITTKDNPDVNFEDAINKALNGHYSVYLTRENLSSYNVFDSEIHQHKAMGTVFPIVFLAIALLTILTTMTRIVNNQRTQIGTLKAIGFQKRKILRHYLSYGFWLSLSGSILGAIIGPTTLPKLFYPAMQTTYTLPEWTPAISPAFLIMAFVSVFVCTLATYFACISNLKDTPSQTLRPKSPKLVNHSVIEKSKLWLKLDFTIQWNLRDIFRSKIRSLMAIIGVIGCTALLVCAFGIQDSLDDVINWQYNEINQFNSKLTLSNNISTEQINSIKTLINGEAIMEGAMEIKAGNKKKTGELLVTDQVTLIKPTDANRNRISLPTDGISISYKIAKLLDVKKGDTVRWHIFGDEKWVESTVGEIYRSPVSQGITLTKELFVELGYTFLPTSILTDQIVTTTLDGVENIWSISDLTESYETMTEAMNIMVYVLIFAAVILAVVVLYNLGILSFTERVRELATLKVIGFQTKKIRNLILTQTIWLTGIGILFGIPTGNWLIDFMLSYMGDSFDMMRVTTISTVFVSMIITLALSIFVNLLFSGKMKRIDMVSSLKGVE